MLGLGNSITGGAQHYDTAFAPADFGNLDIHYDFSLLSGSNGDGIASFANGGAAGSDYNLAQSTGSLQPTIDTSAMAANSAAFDNSNDKLDAANPYITTDQTFTFFVVFETGQAGSDAFFAGDVGDNLNFIQLAGANGVAIQTKFVGNTAGSNNSAITTKTNGTESAGTNGDINHTFRVSTPEILIMTRDASENNRFFNHTGGLIATSTSDATDSDTNFRFQRLGAAGTGGSPYDGNIGEIGLYNIKLSDSEVATLANYLATKWSVS
tara:strand:- start:197 stop:997 length:801 start_codon:yes stop_codon:yes gene_type:complete